jgi:hypothetical protein
MTHFKWMTLAGAGAMFVAGTGLIATPAHAQLVADGITYTLTETVVNPTMDDFTLSITGINGTTDAEGNRFGVQSFSFNNEGTGWTITPPTGFSLMSGGLDSKGCNGHGAKTFCFFQPAMAVGTTVLKANSSLSYSFDISGSGLSSWDPSFKINWLGTQNNYDLVSKTLTPTSSGPSRVPEPGTAALFLTGLLGFGMRLLRRAPHSRAAAAQYTA